MSGVNGVYVYGSGSNFPSSGWNNTNYWVDVVLSATPPPAVTLSSIAVAPVNQTITIGATQQFTATGTYSDGSTQSLTSQAAWSSTSTGVAGISSGGLATAVAVGSTTISAALSGVTGSTSLTVQAAPPPPPTLSSIALTPAGQTILVGATQQFTATGTYSDGSTQSLTSQAAWSSTSTGVAGISSGGLATAVAVGSTTISATLSGVAGSTGLTVQAAPLSITTSSLPGGTLNASYTATLTASGGTLPYTWAIVSGSLPTGLSLNGGIISGTATAAGTFNFTVQVTDSTNPMQTATKALSIAVTTQSNFTIWPGTVPGTVDSGPDSAVELGVKFRSDTAGYITGIRFYKASTNTGTHVGNLWTSTGTRMATATFANETASGWQQVNFSTPVAITANTVYVASYHTNTGHYSVDTNYFTGKGMDSPPLHALANGVSGVNGVYVYGSGSNFPSSGWNNTNYWVDVVLSATPPPAVTLSSIAVAPVNQTITIGATQQFTATGTYSDGSTQSLTSQAAWSSTSTGVAGISSGGLATAVAVGSTTISATLSGVTGSTSLTVQAAPLSITTSSLPGGTLNASYTATLTASGGTLPYTWAIVSGSLPTGLSLNGGIISGTATAAGTFNFTVQVTDSTNPMQTATKALSIAVGGVPQKPILIISSSANPFTGYYSEILRNEGFNEFEERDISTVSYTILASYDVAIIGEMALTTGQVQMLTDWVNAGGNLIAMRPDKNLASLLGLTAQSSTLSNAYLLVDTSSGPGVGIVNQSIQFHGTADLYTISGATVLATLYSNTNTATVNPAVTLKNVGGNGGQAAAFTYDLARSVVYTRQGNPAWAGQERDGVDVIRSDDLFYGDASYDHQPDWIDMDKVAIPQADEQQRLLANLIVHVNFSKRPLPRFGYLPHNLEAAVVMTGDDHAIGSGTIADRFDYYMSISPQGCSVENWECIRGTSYLYPDSDLTEAQAVAYNSVGFEVALHVTTNCADWTPSTLESFYADQIGAWLSKYQGLPLPVTNRTHCIAWSDYATQPKVEVAHGIGLDTNYYYYPPSWIADRPGFFTGSGMPMRFADSNGNLIDVYQATTQMTDESGQSYPYTIDTLLDKAIGPEGYYGVFTVNAHTDASTSSESDSIVQSAMARGIPVITARQLLAWLDGRNASTFDSLFWSGNALSFSINIAQGANGLVAMLPVEQGKTVSRVMNNGNAVPFTMQVIKGVLYASFYAANGAFQVDYVSDVTPPTVSTVSPINGTVGVSTITNVTATFSEPMDPASIGSGAFELHGLSNILIPASIIYNANTQTSILDPTDPLSNSTTYSARIKGGTAGVKDLAGNPLNNDFVWSFTTEAAPTGTFTIWPGTVPGTVDSGPDSAVELGVKFRSDMAGYITGIRFYKASTNTGTHVGNLWTSTGTLLATATFTNETASGWQQVNFATPVPITANTVYVASYHTNTGHYSDDQKYFTGKGMDSPPLHALASGVSGGKRRVRLRFLQQLPQQGWNSSNYWVDVVFQP